MQTSIARDVSSSSTIGALCSTARARPKDWRCPPEQAQRYWSALKRNGVETALLLFPGEDHELTRAGQPRHRLERFEHILAWWAKHLPTPQNHG